MDGIFEAFASARFEQLELTRADGNSIEVTDGDVVVERSTFSKGNIGVRANDGDITVLRSTFDDTGSNAIYQQGPGGVKVADSKLLHIGSTGISEYEGGSVSIKGSTVKDTSSNVVYESAEGSIRVAKSKSFQERCDRLRRIRGRERDDHPLETRRLRIERRVRVVGGQPSCLQLRCEGVGRDRVRRIRGRRRSH